MLSLGIPGHSAPVSSHQSSQFPFWTKRRGGDTRHWSLGRKPGSGAIGMAPVFERA